MEKQSVSGIKIAMVYIGTVVGAGFATGQEILQFFVSFGLGGLWGALLTAGLFMFFGVVTMEMGYALRAKSHLEVIGYAGGGRFQTVMDVLIMVSLFGALTAMMAGTGALFAQQWGISAALGSLLMGVLTVLTVLRGLPGVIHAISIVVPFLLVSVLAISVFSLLQSPPDFTADVTRGGRGLMGNWLTAAILYVSYNILMSVSVLGPTGGLAVNRRAVWRGGILGGAGLGAASILIYLALSGTRAETGHLEVPILHMAGGIAPIAGALYSLVLLAEIYTTAVGALYGFSARLLAGRDRRFGVGMIISGAAGAFLVSLFGFSGLVRYMYPLQGYGGILLLVALVWVKVRRTPPR